MFAELLLAIKFKVRFYLRFQKQYGPDPEIFTRKQWYDRKSLEYDVVQDDLAELGVEYRLTKYCQRHMTLYAQVFHSHRIEKSKRMIRSVLERLVVCDKMYVSIAQFLMKGRKLVSLCRRTTYLGRMRLAAVTSKLDEEVVYLTWFYDRKLRGYRNQNTKSFKMYSNVYKKLKALKDSREKEIEDARAVRQSGALGQPLLMDGERVVLDCSRLIEYECIGYYLRYRRAGYMLEFTIW